MPKTGRTHKPTKENAMNTYRFTCACYQGTVRADSVKQARRKAWFATGQVYAFAEIKVRKINVLVEAIA